MKLAIFTSHFPGRINTFFARDVRGLIDAGLDVEIFATHPLEPHLWQFVPDELSNDVLPRHKVHHLALAGAVRTGWGALDSWRHLRDIGSISAASLAHGATALAKSHYVIAKGLSWARTDGARFDHVLAYWGNYAATCAYVFHQASGASTPFSTYLHAGTDLYRSRVFLEQKLLHADNIIVVCDFNRTFLRDVYPQAFPQMSAKVYLHHLGLDLEQLRFQPGGRPRNRLVAAGGLHPAKGFDDLLRAVATLTKDGHEIDAVLVGGGPEEPQLRQLAGTLGVERRVRFLGWQSPDQVLTHIRSATVLVHPSIGLGDAVPTVIKEAMALGTPVIASAVAGIPELLDEGRCGVLSAPRDPEGLAHAIAALLGDEVRRARLARLARVRAEQLFCQSRNGAALAARLRQTSRGPVPKTSAQSA